MAIGIYFKPQGFPTDRYDEVLGRLEQAGEGAPAGRTHHFAWVGQDGVEVFDVWDSQESFDKFGETLIPIMNEVGADPGEPASFEIYSMILG